VCVSPRLPVSAASVCQLTFILVSVCVSAAYVSPRLPVSAASVCQLISVCVSAARVC
jgi:hypothetical protein